MTNISFKQSALQKDLKAEFGRNQGKFTVLERKLSDYISQLQHNEHFGPTWFDRQRDRIVDLEAENRIELGAIDALACRFELLGRKVADVDAFNTAQIT